MQRVLRLPHHARGEPIAEPSFQTAQR